MKYLVNYSLIKEANRPLCVFIATMVSFLATTVPSYSASFTCGKNLTVVEGLICKDHHLSSTDSEMAQKYKELLRRQDDESSKQDYKQKQREWLAVRNSCSTLTCLRNVYKDQIGTLNLDLGFVILRDENIGGLRMDLPASKVKEIMQPTECKAKRGAEGLRWEDGLYEQYWDYKKCGISLTMVSEKKGGAKKVNSITVTHPCDFSTKRSIHIGSSEREVIEAYKIFWDKDDSVPGRSFVAGSIYGGLIFRLKDGKVSEIFLGAMAE